MANINILFSYNGNSYSLCMKKDYFLKERIKACLPFITQEKTDNFSYIYNSSILTNKDTPDSIGMKEGETVEVHNGLPTKHVNPSLNPSKFTYVS